MSRFYLRIQVQRVDTYLRARFPHLVTRIFETTSDRFEIYFDAALEDASAIADEFHSSIRYLTLSVSVTNDLPAQFVREVEPLSDAEAAGVLAGFAFSQGDMENLLWSNFRNLPIERIEAEREAETLVIDVSVPLETQAEAEVRAFVTSLGVFDKVEVRMSEGPFSQPSALDRNPMFIHAAKKRPHAPAYVREDEAFFFDNLADIGAGRLPPSRFPGMTDGAFRCFLDLTTGRHVNIRQALMLYDEVYAALPLATEHAAFLHDQNLTDADILTLVESGRLKFVTTQPEERLSLNLLSSVHERSSVAILGRRTTAALLAADVSHTAALYRLDDSSFGPALRELSRLVSPLLDIDPDALLRFMLWPFEAQREGLLPLLQMGSKATPAGELGGLTAALVRAANGDNIELEMSVFSERVHIGHALDATVIAALDEPPIHSALARTVGFNLNFFRGFSKATIAAWAGNEQRRAEGVRLLPPIELFNFDALAPVSEFLGATELRSTRTQG